MSFGPGMVVGDRYELGRQLGAGGMARVYLAHDRLLDREVAVKVLAERYAADDSFVERFRREASSAAGLNHPNIVSVYDRGEADGNYYIVMEYLSGPDLKEVIRRRAPLPPGEAVDYALQILSALAAAHRRDVIHRDVKPQNVMVAEDGHLKVTDFGIARAGANSGMTEVGSIIGTAQYLSPEQARGDEVTAASDCYSVGIVLYEMLTGRVPFDGDRPVAVAMKQVSEPPVPPRQLVPSIPPDLDALVVRALEKRPSDRFRTAEDMSRALLDVRAQLEGGTGATRAFAAIDATGSTRVMPGAGREPTAATRLAPPPVPLDDAPPRRSRTPLVVGLLALLLLLGLGAALLLSRDSGAEMVTVPTGLAGTPADAAEARLREAGLDPRRVDVANPTVPVGIVVGTRPPGGTEVEEGSTVTLQVSGGPRQETVPDVTGTPVDEARAALEDLGFQVTTAEEPSEDVAEGEVIRQTPAGDSQAAAGSTVALVVSAGVPQATVPDVRRFSVSEAQQRLEAVDLRLGSQTPRETDRFPAGTVVDQSPGPTAEVDPGTAVDVVVATAPEPEPEPPPVTETEPETVAVPDVVGDDADTARGRLEDAGLVVTSSTSEPSGGEAAGVVLETSPPAGTELEVGDRVVIIVSSGPGEGGGDEEGAADGDTGDAGAAGRGRSAAEARERSEERRERDEEKRERDEEKRERQEEKRGQSRERGG